MGAALFIMPHYRISVVDDPAPASPNINAETKQIYE